MNTAQAKREARTIVASYIADRVLGSEGASSLMPKESDNDKVLLAIRELCWMIVNPTTSVNLMPKDYAKPGICRPYRVKRK